MDTAKEKTITEEMTMAQKIMAKLNNEEIAEENRNLNESEPCADKGKGFCLPEELNEDQKKMVEKQMKFAEKDLEYPNLQLIFCRKGKLASNPNEEQIVFIEGGDCDEAFLTLRLENLCAGEYYVLYRVDFKPTHKYRKLNLVFYSEFMQKKS
jgi:hypothetical protein